ncbi:uncharacterized protein LOC125661865 isoform X2 [Ostrea edulis]|uniref:uncharacterized protein LOC125661865 isoform X2 n=1 Tax=Ostrea edulis TaxID=37623 RepID=UPI0024AEA5C8|nr:uncharacterized protein LOC125661865 isoform X2 [Ostrea edulis]
MQQEEANYMYPSTSTERQDFDFDAVWDGIVKNVYKSDVITPTMVFSVIGDSNSFVPSPWPKAVFQTGLIEAAKNGGDTWIIYRGKKHGLSKIIRDAYRDYGNMEFGIKNKEKHLNNEERHVKLISVTGTQTRDGLAPEHSLCLMNEVEEPTVIVVSDEQIGDDAQSKLVYSIQLPDVEKNMLVFEKFVSTKEGTFFSQNKDFRIRVPVPVAIIVCEGDILTIAHVEGALEMKLPVIVVKGSGKAADLIVDYLEDQNSLKRKASLLFGIRFDDQNFKTLEQYLSKIKEKEELLSFFDVNNDDPLMFSNVVGEAIVSCWAIEKILGNKEENSGVGSVYTKGPPQYNVNSTFSIGFTKLNQDSVTPQTKQMTQVLNEYKESRTYVIQSTFSTPSSLPLYFYFGYQLLQESNLLQSCGHILLLEALKSNRCDYVRVLLDQDVKLNMNDLPELYESTVSCKDCQFKHQDCLHMQWILKQIQEKFAKKIFYKNRSIKEKLRKAENEKDENDLEKYRKKCKKKIGELGAKVVTSARGLCRKLLKYKGEDKISKPKKDSEGNLEVKDTDVSDILLWALFANRKDLAEICWLRSKDHLLTGLVSSAILKKLSKKANNVKEQILSRDLENHSMLFQKRCLDLMDRMYEENTNDAIDLMDDETEVWGIHSSPLTFAYENFMYDIVAHTCSQKNMNKVWYNNLAPDTWPFICSVGRKPRKFFTAPLTKYIYNFVMFFSMLMMYSAFVLTSVSTQYYDRFLARFLEYYVYFWGAGDLIEELISCFLKDLLRFLVLAVFVVLGVGMYYHANLWPDHQTIWDGYWTEWRIWRIIYYPYWQLYGEAYNEFLEGKELSDCSNVTSVWQNDPSIERCPQEDWTVSAISAIYMLFSNLLLVNLVIAMFSYTFERVQENSERLWRFQRYTVIIDYQWRIPSPINLLFLPYRFYIYVKKYRESCSRNQVGEGNKGDDPRDGAVAYRIDFQKIIAFRICNKM